MKKYSLFLVILLILSSHAFAKSEKWKGNDIVGYNLKLIDPEEYQSFSFGSPDHHLVAATFGAVGGPITFPLCYWNIDKNGILYIKDWDGKVRFRLKKIYQKDGKVGVELSRDQRGLHGKKVEYEKTKAP